MLIIILLSLFFLLIFEVGLIFLNVVVSVAPVSLGPKLKISSCFPPSINANLSEVSSSVDPLDLINEYLSSSKGRNVSFVPAFTTDDLFYIILTLKDFLITKLAFVKSTEEILLFGNIVYNVLSSDANDAFVNTLRSVTSNAAVGNCP